MAKIFYSRNEQKRGTAIEKYERDLIASWFAGTEGETIHIAQRDKPTDVDQYVFGAIDECEYFVFSTTSGLVSREVFNEIVYAYRNHLTVYEIYGNALWELEDVPEFQIIYEGDGDEYAVETRGIPYGYSVCGDCDCTCGDEPEESFEHVVLNTTTTYGVVNKKDGKMIATGTAYTEEFV